mmetsp:Transcript_45314/g.144207  ORF Transcript_45314/g.144207 Transcript_45314/m.144207 type:complete len:132 (+) Transcript_45314:96-491(+)
MYTLLSGTRPFDDDDHGKLLASIEAGAYTFPAIRWVKKSEDCKDLIRQMLTVDPDERIRLEDIFCHPWMAPIVAEQEKIREFQAKWKLMRRNSLADKGIEAPEESMITDLRVNQQRRNSYAGMSPRFSAAV